MEREQLHKLVDFIAMVQSRSDGKKTAYVNLDMSNFTGQIIVTINDDGFNGPHDVDYRMDLNCKSERTFDNCINHLTDLRNKLQEAQ